MMTKETKNNRGFVILFAVTLSALLLAIALGITNIAFRELKFSTNARDTNDAFFAADTGLEYALFNDKAPNSIYPPNTYTGPFSISGLGNGGQSCAIVTVDKTLKEDGKNVIFTSKGYNIGESDCTSSNPNRIERQLELRYIY